MKLRRKKEKKKREEDKNTKNFPHAPKREKGSFEMQKNARHASSWRA